MKTYIFIDGKQEVKSMGKIIHVPGNDNLNKFINRVDKLLGTEFYKYKPEIIDRLSGNGIK